MLNKAMCVEISNPMEIKAYAQDLAKDLSLDLGTIEYLLDNIAEFDSFKMAKEEEFVLDDRGILHIGDFKIPQDLCVYLTQEGLGYLFYSSYVG